MYWDERRLPIMVYVVSKGDSYASTCVPQLTQFQLINYNNNLVVTMSLLEARNHLFLMIGLMRKLNDGYDSDESFHDDLVVDVTVGCESIVHVTDFENPKIEVGVTFEDSKCFKKAIRQYAVKGEYEIAAPYSEATRYMGYCKAKRCKWRIHASQLQDGKIWQLCIYVCATTNSIPVDKLQQQPRSDHESSRSEEPHVLDDWVDAEVEYVCVDDECEYKELLTNSDESNLDDGYDSDESFHDDLVVDATVGCESIVHVTDFENPKIEVGVTFEDSKCFKKAIRQYAVKGEYEIAAPYYEATRYMGYCKAKRCKWRIHASQLQDGKIWQPRSDHESSRSEEPPVLDDWVDAEVEYVCVDDECEYKELLTNSDESNLDDGYDSDESFHDDLVVDVTVGFDKLQQQPRSDHESSRSEEPPVLDDWVDAAVEYVCVDDECEYKELLTNSDESNLDDGYDSDESFHDDLVVDVTVGCESIVHVTDFENPKIEVGVTFEDSKCFKKAIRQYAVKGEYEIAAPYSEATRYMGYCKAKRCKWRIHASQLQDGKIWQLCIYVCATTNSIPVDKLQQQPRSDHESSRSEEPPVLDDWVDAEVEYVCVDDECEYKELLTNSDESNLDDGYDSDESFHDDLVVDVTVGCESIVHVTDFENPKIEVGVTFEDSKYFKKAIRQYALKGEYEIAAPYSEATRYMGYCKAKRCKWRIHASQLQDGKIWQIKKIPREHNCGSTETMEKNCMANNHWQQQQPRGDHESSRSEEPPVLDDWVDAEVEYVCVDDECEYKELLTNSDESNLDDGYDSDESFHDDLVVDVTVGCESIVHVTDFENPKIEVGVTFEDSKCFKKAIRQYAVKGEYEIAAPYSEATRYMGYCKAKRCKWRIHASQLQDGKIWQPRSDHESSSSEGPPIFDDWVDAEVEYVGVDDECEYKELLTDSDESNFDAGYDSNESFHDNLIVDVTVGCETTVHVTDFENPKIEVGVTCEDGKCFKKAIRQYAVKAEYEIAAPYSEATRYMGYCKAKRCKWRIHAGQLQDDKEDSKGTQLWKHMDSGEELHGNRTRQLDLDSAAIQGMCTPAKRLACTIDTNNSSMTRSRKKQSGLDAAKSIVAAKPKAMKKITRKVEVKRAKK
ncbi:hypothetical protein ACQ4PT_029472 [Festuca glaucescens]